MSASLLVSGFQKAASHRSGDLHSLLPQQEELGGITSATAEAVEREVDALIDHAHSGNGGKTVAPSSASKPLVNVFIRAKPAVATVKGNFRTTAPGSGSDVRHIVLAFADMCFPVLEGQSIGVAERGL